MKTDGSEKKILKKFVDRTAKVVLLAVLFVLVFSSVLFACIGGGFDFNDILTNSGASDNGNVAYAEGVVSSQRIDLSNVFTDATKTGPININPAVGKRGRSWTTNTDHTSVKPWNDHQWDIGNNDRHGNTDYAGVWFDFDLGPDWTKLSDSINVTFTGTLNTSGVISGYFIGIGSSATAYGDMDRWSGYDNEVKNNSAVTKTNEKATGYVSLNHSVRGRYIRIYYVTYSTNGRYGDTWCENVNINIQRTLKTYTTAYNANGGSGSVAPTSHKFMSASNVSSEFFNRTNFYQTGWNTANNGNGVAMGFGASTGTSTGGGTYGSVVRSNLVAGNSTTTLYAVWAAIAFKFYKTSYTNYNNEVLQILQTKTNVDYVRAINVPAGLTSKITYDGGSSARPTTLGSHSAVISIYNASGAFIGSRTINFSIIEGDFGKLGSGTSGIWGCETNPFIISAKQHLINLSAISNGTQPALNSVINGDDVSAADTVAADASYENCFFLVTADIDLNNDAILPIGPGAKTFKANFNGNGHSVINLKITAEGHSGLFCFVAGTTAKVRNLTVRGSITGTSYIGVIAELAGGATADGIANYASVTGTGTGDAYVGGIVGIMHGESVIKNCANYGTVHSAGNDIGGILGRAGSASGTAGIENCVNYGTVYGAGNNIGGILGILFNSGATMSINGCTNKGTVYSTGGTKVGGIAGTANGTSGTLYIKGAISNTGAIGQSGYKRDHTGGIVGDATSRFDFSGATSLNNSGTIYGGTGTGGIIGYNNGRGITEGATNSGAVNGGVSQTGGIVGYSTGGSFGGTFVNTGKISGSAMTGGIGGQFHSTFTSGASFTNGDVNNKNSTTVGNVAGTGDSVGGVFAFIDKPAANVIFKNYGSVSGASSVGGIIGRAQNVINSAENRGNVTATGTKSDELPEAGSAVGGITGYTQFNITNCTNYGTINAAGASAGNFAGGIAGTYFAGSAATVSGCVNHGVVNGKNYTGGIAGSWNGSITDCKNHAAVTGVAITGGITGKSNGRVEKSANYGTVKSTGSATAIDGAAVTQGAYLGGIAGYSSGTIANCLNGGNVAVSSAYSSSNIVGGIAGRGAVITYCANTGTAAGSENVGGITGIAGGAVTFCYGIGTVNSVYPHTATNVGAVVGLLSGGSVSNSWGIYYGEKPATANGSSYNANLLGNIAEIGISAIGVADIIPYQNNWESILTTNINGWGIRPGAITAASGSLISITTPNDGKYAAPNVIETGASAGSGSDEATLGSTVTVNALKFLADNNAGYINISVKSLSVTGSNVGYNSVNRFNDAGRWTVNNLPGGLSNKLVKFLYFKNSVIDWQRQSSFTSVNAGQYNLSLLVNGYAAGQTADVLLGTTPAHQSATFRITPFLLKPTAKAVNGWNAYVFSGNGCGITLVQFALAGNDNNNAGLKNYIKAEQTKGGEVSDWLTSSLTFINGINYSQHVCDSRFISSFKINPDIADEKRDNYSFNTTQEVTLNDGSTLTGGITYDASSLAYAWTISPATIDAGKLTVKATAGWNHFNYNAENQGVYSAVFNFGQADRYIRGELSSPDVDGNTVIYTVDVASGKATITNAKNAGTHTLTFVISHKTDPRYSDDYVFDVASKSAVKVDGAADSISGVAVSADKKTITYTWKTEPFDFTNATVRYDGLSGGYDSANGEYIDKATFDNANKYVSGGFVWYDGQLAANKDRASVNGSTLFIMYNYGLSEASFGSFLFKEDNRRTHTEDRLIKFFMGDPALKNDIITDINEGKSDIDHSDWISPINVVITNYTVNGVSYATFAFTISGSNNFIDGRTVTLTAFITDGDFKKCENIDETHPWGGDNTHTYEISNWLNLFRLSQIVNGKGNPFDSVKGLGVFGLKNETSLNGKYGGALARPSAADNGGVLPYYYNADGILNDGFAKAADISYADAYLSFTANLSASSGNVDWSGAFKGWNDSVTNAIDNAAGAAAEADPNFTTYYFRPIGNRGNKTFSTAATDGDDMPFAGDISGQLPGGANVIINLTVDLPANDYVGFFGYVSGGSVSYVTTDGTVKGRDGAGGISGFTRGNLNACINNADVSGNNYVGGITGYAGQHNTVGNLTNTGSVGGGNYVGGIGGRLQDVAVTGTIQNGVADTGATVTATGDNAGGLTGHLYGANTVNAAAIINFTAINGGSNVGGIAGSLQWGTLTSAENHGTVTATGDNAGGILGFFNAPSVVRGTFNNDKNVRSSNNAGGLFGKINADYSTAGTPAEINVTDGSNSGAVTVSGNAAGGIAGYYNQNGTNSTVIFENVKNGGEVKSEGKISSGTGKFVGGIIGEAHGGNIKALTEGGLQVTANVRGDVYAGGIIGYGERVNIQINRPYLTTDGTRTGNAIKVYGASYVGALFGEFTGTGYKNSDGNLKRYSYLPWLEADKTDSGLLILGDVKAEIRGTGTDGTYKGGYVGALAGKFGGAAIYADNGYQTPKNNSITVNVQPGYEKDYVGGVIGYLAADGIIITGKTTEDGTTSPAGIENLNSVTATGSDYVGGIIGCLEPGAGGAQYDSNNNLLNTRIFGVSVYLKDDSLPPDAEGNRVNERALFSNNSEFHTDLKTISGAAYVGGIIGGTSVSANGLSSTMKCARQNTMNIHASGSYAGGFMGYVGHNIVVDSSGTKTGQAGQNGFSTGGTENNITVEGGGNYVGGIVGYLSDANHMFNFVWSTAKVVGKDCVGGLFGLIKGMETLRSSFVTLPDGENKTSSSDMVKATGLGASNSPESGVGGIVGRIERGSFENVYSIGYKYDSFNTNGTVKEIGGNLSDYSGGIAGYAEAAGVSTNFNMTGALYLSGAGDVYPDYRATSKSNYGNYMIADSSIATLPGFAEMKIAAGFRTEFIGEYETFATDKNTLPAAEKSVSVKLNIPDGNNQLVFYNANGYDETSKNKIAMTNQNTAGDSSYDNPKVLYARMKLTDKTEGATTVDNFSVCKTEIIFQNVPRRGDSSLDEWRNVWQKQLKRPNNDQGFKAVFDEGYPKALPPDNYPYEAAGKLDYKPYVTTDGAENGDHDYTTAGNFVTVGKFYITYNPGSPGAPMIINNQEDWNEFARNVRENTASGGYGNGMYFKLGDDVVSGNNKINVGITNLAGDVSDGENETLNTKHYFSGNFDGNGGTIHLNINTSAGSASGSNNSRRLGLFPNAADATFRNLTIDGNITTKTDDVNDGYDVAGFVGKPFGNLTFKNCVNKVDITARRLAAGIVGYTRGFQISMTGCVNEGRIETSEGMSWHGGSDNLKPFNYEYGTGGLIALVMNNTTIESCLNKGEIIGGQNVGGLIGQTNGTDASPTKITLKNCANTGIIRAVSECPNDGDYRGMNVWSNVGGLIGVASGFSGVYAYGCYNSGGVYARGNVAGGLFGCIGTIPDKQKPHQAWGDNLSVVRYCYNSGPVKTGFANASKPGAENTETPQGGTNSTFATGVKFSGTDVGGIAGLATWIDMSYVYNAGTVTSYGIAGADFAWHIRAGGLIGETACSGKNGPTVKISNAYNVGTINLYERGVDADPGDGRYSAGIVGYMDEDFKGSVTVTDGNTFSLHNQVKYGNTYMDWRAHGAQHDTGMMRNGTVIGSIADYTGVYKGNTLGQENLVLPLNTTISNAWGGSSVETLIDSNGYYRTTDDLASGNLKGFVYAYGCLPQLAVFALDTENELSMLSQSFGADQYGNIQQHQAGSEESPYIIKDGIDLLMLSQLTNSNAGSTDTYWHGTDKYIEFAGQRVDSKGNTYSNNIDGVSVQSIKMPTGERDVDAFTYTKPGGSGATFKGKNYFLYERGAVVANSPNTSVTTTYNLWKAGNNFYNGNSWVTGATLANFNFLPIAMNAYGFYFGGNISGLQQGGNPNTEITGLNVDYTVSKIGGNRDDVAIAGLFGKVQNATIKNITVTGSVKNRSITTSKTPRIYTGGIVGLAYGKTTLENLQAGGGQVFKSEAKRHDLVVESRFNQTQSADDNTGGIVGKASTYSTALNGTEESVPCTANVVNCTSYANVTGAHSVAGGIAGCAVAAPDATLNFDECKTLKGVIGVSRSSDGADGTNTAGSYIGGIVGGVVKIETNGTLYDVAGNVIFNGCQAGDGKVASVQTPAVTIRGENTVGGISGNAGGSVSFVNSGVYGDVKIEKRAYAAASKSANRTKDGSCIGGIAGFINGPAVISGTTVSAGYVSADNTPSGQIISNVGGIAGFMKDKPRLSGVIKVIGKISADMNGVMKNVARPDDNTIYAVSGIGGVAGEASSVVFNGTYDVTADITAPSAGNVGGIIGYNSGACVILAAQAPADVNKLTVGGSEGSAERANILGYDSVGGIIGSSVESIDVGLTELDATVYYGKLEIRNFANVNGRHRIAGIQGKNAGETTIKGSATVINSGKVGTDASKSGGIVDDSKAGNTADDGIEKIKLQVSNFFGGIVAFNGAGSSLTFEEGSVLQNAGQVGIEPAGATTACQYFVGGVIGSNAGGFVNKGTLGNTGAGNVFGYKYVGGSIGRLKEGTISGTLVNDGAVTAYANVGGSIGEVSVNGKVNNAELTNNGAVIALNRMPSTFIDGNNNVGGIIGTFHGNITNSELVNNGTVNGWQYVGGTIGVITGTVNGSNFINHGLVSARGVEAVGGAAGLIINSYPNSIGEESTAALSIENSHFEYSALGGVAGGAGEASTAEYTAAAAGDVINPAAGETNLYAGEGLTAPSNGGSVGGVIGFIKNAAGITAAKWDTVSVYVNGDVTAPNASNVGGVVGKIENSPVRIKNMLAYKNSIEGYKYVGGIVGFNGSSLQGEDPSLENCYNVGGEVVGASFIGGIVGGFEGQTADGSDGGANSPKTKSCYWVKGFKNAALQDATENDLSTANMVKHEIPVPDHILAAGDTGYEADFVFDGVFGDAYLTAYLDFLKGKYGKVAEDNGFYVYFTQAAGTIRYSTGNEYTGFFFAYANDAQSSGIAEADIATEHRSAGSAFTNLDFWKYIADAYTKEEREAGADKAVENVVSDIILNDGDSPIHGAVPPTGKASRGHIYAKAMLPTGADTAYSNGYYLYATQNKNTADDNKRINSTVLRKNSSVDDTHFYYDADASAAGNVLLFYKQLKVKQNLIYNGKMRYAPVYNVGRFDDKDENLVFNDGDIDVKVKGGYTFVLGEQRRDGDDLYNFAIDNSVDGYCLDGTVYVVDFDGQKRIVGKVETDTISSEVKFGWKINKRILKTGTTSNQASNETYDTTFNHYIEVTADNVAVRDAANPADGFTSPNNMKFNFKGSAYFTWLKTFVNKQQIPANDDANNAVFYTFKTQQSPVSVQGNGNNLAGGANGPIKSDAAVGLINYTFRVYFKNAETYSLTVESKTEPVNSDPADFIQGERDNYVFQQKTQTNKVSRATLSADGVSYYHNGAYQSGSDKSSHAWDGHEHGIRIDFKGFAGSGANQENGDTVDVYDNKKLIDLLEEKITCSGNIPGKAVKVNTKNNALLWVAVDKGTYTVTLTDNADIGTNYKLSAPTKSYTFTITPYQANVTFTDWLDTYGYTGTNQSFTAQIEGSTVNGGGTLSSDAWQSFTAALNNSINKSGGIKLDPKGVEIKVTSTYNSDTVYKAAVTFTVKDVSSATDDKYTASVGLSTDNPNFTLTSGSKTFEITPKEVGLLPSESDRTFTYDGAYHGIGFKTSLGSSWGGDSLSAAADYTGVDEGNAKGVRNFNTASGTNGKWTISQANLKVNNVVFNPASNKNYTITGVEPGHITIKKKPVSVTWSNSGPFTYRGGTTPQKPSASIASGVTGETINPVVTIVGQGGGIDAGDYTARVSSAGFTVSGGRPTTNYLLTSSSKDYTVNKKNISVKWDDNNLKLPYNGKNRINDFTISATGAVSGETIVLVWPKTADAVHVGVYPVAVDNGFTVTGGRSRADNYNLTGALSGNLQITPKTISILSTDWFNQSFVYSATGHAPTAVTSGGVTGDVITFSLAITPYAGGTLTGGEAVNAGNYNVVASIATVSGGPGALGDYVLDGTTNKTSMTITPAKLTVKLNDRNGKAFKQFDPTNQTTFGTALNKNGNETANSLKRSGLGFTVSGFMRGEANDAVTISANFAEAGDGRSAFNGYINNVVLVNGNYIIDSSPYNYKKLVFTKTETNGTHNYVVEIVNGRGAACSGQFGGSGQETGYVYDSRDTAHKQQGLDYSLTVEITKFSLRVSYVNTVQSYVNDDNTFKNPDDWTDVEGSVDAKYKVKIAVTQGWQATNPKKYTVINGVKGDETLCAVIETSSDGIHINYDIYNQPTLVLGYFITIDGGNANKISTLSDLLLATYYYEKSISGDTPTTVDYMWKALCTLSEYNAEFPSAGKDILDVDGNVIKWKYEPADGETLTGTAVWDAYFAAYEAAWKAWADAAGWVGSDMSIRVDINEDGTDYGFMEPYKKSIEGVFFFNFKQTENISGIMTEKDLEILNAQFGSDWGYGKNNLQNVMSAEVGGVVTLYDALFTGGRDADGKYRGFAGIYDGSGYSIDGLNIVSIIDAAGVRNVGFIGYLKGTDSVETVGEDGAVALQVTHGEVKGLNLRNLTVCVYDGTNGTGTTVNVGGIAGLSDSGKSVENSSVHGTIDVFTSRGGVNAGGIIGVDNYNVLEGETALPSVSGVIFAGAITVNVTADGQSDNNVNAGGIIGKLKNGVTVSNAVAFQEIFLRYQKATGVIGSNNTGGIVGNYEGTDFASVIADKSVNGIDYRSAYLKNGFAWSSGMRGNKSIGNASDETVFAKTYTELRAGSASVFDADNGYKLNGARPHGKYDVVLGDAAARFGLRLADIIDIYYLQFSVTKVKTDTADEYYRSAASWLVGVRTGTDDNPIKVYNTQQLEITRLLRFASFEIMNDITYPQSNVAVSGSGAFIGKITSSPGYNYNINLRGGSTNLFEIVLDGAIENVTITATK